MIAKGQLDFEKVLAVAIDLLECERLNFEGKSDTLINMVVHNRELIKKNLFPDVGDSYAVNNCIRFLHKQEDIINRILSKKIEIKPIVNDNKYFKDITSIIHRLAEDWLTADEKYQIMCKTEEDKYVDHEEEMRIKSKLEFNAENYKQHVKLIANFHFYYKE